MDLENQDVLVKIRSLDNNSIIGATIKTIHGHRCLVLDSGEKTHNFTLLGEGVEQIIYMVRQSGATLETATKEFVSGEDAYLNIRYMDGTHMALGEIYKEFPVNIGSTLITFEPTGELPDGRTIYSADQYLGGIVSIDARPYIMEGK